MDSSVIETETPQDITIYLRDRISKRYKHIGLKSITMQY